MHGPMQWFMAYAWTSKALDVHSQKYSRLRYTANVCRDLQGVYREIRVRGFQIYGDCMLPTIPVVLKPPYSDFHCNICREFDFTWILWGYPTLDVGKSCINYGETM